jgi:hypothetical protein
VRKLALDLVVRQLAAAPAKCTLEAPRYTGRSSDILLPPHDPASEPAHTERNDWPCYWLEERIGLHSLVIAS